MKGSYYMIKLLGIIITFVFLTGCAKKIYLIQPEFKDSIKNVKTIGVIVPNSIVKTIGADSGYNIKGKQFPVDDEASLAAKPIMEQGVILGLKESGYNSKLIKNEEDLKIFNTGYKKMSHELKNHFPGAKYPPTVPSQIDNFDIILKNNNVDCVLAVEGLDHVSTAGRKAAMVGMALLGVTGGGGLTYYYYNLFCNNNGKPMYVDNVVREHSSISDIGDVASNVNFLTKRMFEAAAAK